MEATRSKARKRKADNQDNERLSKRLSLLNLERNGQKLYVPVEQPALSASSPKSKPSQQQKQDDDMMQIDDTKHKVYIYDLDAELSDSESSSDEGRLVFLPDIQKHLRESRIPPSILANSDGELAGHSKELVLYNVPSSLTVPEERDSVRKAIIETRARARAMQEQRLREEESRDSGDRPPLSRMGDAGYWGHGVMNGNASTTVSVTQEAMDVMNGTAYSNNGIAQQMVDDDPDAMDLG